MFFSSLVELLTLSPGPVRAQDGDYQQDGEYSSKFGIVATAMY
jgi:hypothetical protein